jgi:hypothetical protein
MLGRDDVVALLAGDPAAGVAVLTFRPCVWDSGPAVLLEELYVRPEQNFGGDRPLGGRARRHPPRVRPRHHPLRPGNNHGPPYGSAEENFGRILATDLAAHRDELVISTKAQRPWAARGRCVGGSPESRLDLGRSVGESPKPTPAGRAAAVTARSRMSSASYARRHRPGQGRGGPDGRRRPASPGPDGTPRRGEPGFAGTTAGGPGVGRSGPSGWGACFGEGGT